MASQSATPTTATYTSLRDRPVLRGALQAVWAFVAVYVVSVLVNGGGIYMDRMMPASPIIKSGLTQ